MKPKRLDFAKVDVNQSYNVAERTGMEENACRVVSLEAYQLARIAREKEASHAEALRRVLENAEKLLW